MNSNETVVITVNPPKSRNVPNKISYSDRIKQNWNENGASKFLTIAAGIFICFITLGMLKEKIMRGCYGDEENEKCPPERRFKHATTLVGAQMLCAFIVIKIMDLIKPEQKDSTPILNFILGALANTVSMISASLSLRFVTYPIEVIFKSAKPIVVMVLGLLICKRYPIRRYFLVVLMVIGVIVFELCGVKHKQSKESSVNTESSDLYMMQVKGISLLILSLCMDGTLGAIQDRLKDRYSPSFRQMMLSMTACVTVITGSIVIITGEIFEVFEFAKIHPIVLLHLLIFSIAGASGQFFIFTMLSSFGSLTLSITTTVRKFFSMVFSIIFFGNPTTSLQWIGAGIVFSALLADTIFGKHETNRGESSEPGEEQCNQPNSLNLESSTPKK